MGTPNVTPDADQNTVSWLGQSSGVIDLVGRLVSIHQHKQQQAMSQLQGAVQLQSAGFPVDPKSFSKLVKQAKLPIATDPDSLKAWLSSQMDSKAGKDTSQGQKDQAKGGGQGQPMQAPDGASPEHQQAVDMANRIQRGEKIDPGEVMQLRIKTLASQAQKKLNMQAQTDDQKARNTLQVETLKGQALAGDKEARGKLMSLNEIPFDIKQEQWTTMNEEQRQGVLDVAAGHESQGEKVARGQRISESLISSGRLNDPESAMKAGNILASGGTLPPEIKSKMKPFTFSELADSAKLSGELVELGIPAAKLGQVMASAEVGGLENALPKSLNPIVLQQLQIQRGQLGLEKERVGIEGLRYAKEVEVATRMTAAEQRRGITEEQKAQLDNFKSLVELKKAGGDIPKDILKAAQVKAASALNMQVEEVDTFWNFLTGGTELKFSARLTDEGQKVVDKFSGKGTKSPKSSEFQTIIDAVRGKKKPTI
jgi:hypothetical protein